MSIWDACEQDIHIFGSCECSCACTQLVHVYEHHRCANKIFPYMTHICTHVHAHSIYRCANVLDACKPKSHICELMCAHVHAHRLCRCASILDACKQDLPICDSYVCLCAYRQHVQVCKC